MDKYGKYYIVCVGEQIRNEVTNVGVILFNKEGIQVGAKMDTPDRALKRGDIVETEYDSLAAHLKVYPECVPNLEILEKKIDSTGHCMSTVQIHLGGGTLLTEDINEILNRLFDRLVK